MLSKMVRPYLLPLLGLYSPDHVVDHALLQLRLMPMLHLIRLGLLKIMQMLLLPPQTLHLYRLGLLMYLEIQILLWKEKMQMTLKCLQVMPTKR
jgi:hypothetical protein